ncbi:MAG: transcription-repair coupling factor [Clostridia bacterium]|nr:transcription-repair coupling factor [Clostridia bacterium]
MINTSLLCGEFRLNRDYLNLLSALRRPFASGRFKPLQVRGLSEGAERTFLAALSEDLLAEAEEKAEDGLLILLPEEKEAAELTSFLDSAGISSLFFPSRDYNYNHMTSSHTFEHARLEVLSALLTDPKPRVIVSTPEAILQLTMSPTDLDRRTIRIDFSRPLLLEELVPSLTEAGYERVDLVEGEGEFSVRGGVVDIYPPSDHPIRIELFGDEIDRMGYFDPVSQRFLEKATGPLNVCPVREIIPSPEERRRASEILRAHLAKCAKKEMANPSLEIIREEIRDLEENLRIDYSDKYLPLFCPEGICFLSYFKGKMLFKQPASLERKTRASEELNRHQILDMIERGELPALKTGKGYLRTWEDLEAAARNCPTIFVDDFLRSSETLPAGEQFLFPTRHLVAYGGNLALLQEDVASWVRDGYMVAVLVSSEEEQKSLAQMFQDLGFSAGSADGDGEEFFSSAGSKIFPIALLKGDYPAGFELSVPRFVLACFSSAVSRSARVPRKLKHIKAKNAGEEILSYADLQPGDLVVHAAYGIGRFTGIDKITVDGITKDYITIQYAGTDKLFLQVDQLELVSRYIGAGADDGSVPLSKMYGGEWKKAKERASKETKEMAKELITLYAQRKRSRGISFDPDDEMSMEFAESFEYEETDGQTLAIDDIRKDMEAPCPMDRLLCGDVGYGKTEVAVRAAFKAVSSGYQVALLVPTTILAYQHYQTFLSRFRGFPCNVEMLSRFRTPKQQAHTLRALKRGEVDVLIGTHRIISQDIEFRKLGLVIVDEEQRFGVAQKEKLKKMAPEADVLTLTATPIPRTMNMAMSGILDMSILDEAPGQRLPVQTYVLEHDEDVLHEAIRREIKRGGQVFYLNNNIESLYHIGNRIQKAIPDARVAVAHGRMDKGELEDVWIELLKGEIDVLVATTIIETGVDVPNANTLIIENADRYGLSQLHQIRGRVGRSSRRAYAYLTYPKMKVLTEVAEKRLSAIKEYVSFGAGFRVALRDLEIRGAGNLLGAQQHGHLDAVGYDMYMKLLNEAVLEEKGEKPEPVPECTVSLKGECYLPERYVSSSAQRMDMYHRMAKIRSYEDFEDVIEELCDRFGDPPREALNLCRVSLCRALGETCGLKKIEETESEIRWTPYRFDPAEITELAGRTGDRTMRVVLAGEPFVAFKKNKTRNIEKTEELLKLFCEIRKERKEKAENGGNVSGAEKEE